MKDYTCYHNMLRIFEEALLHAQGVKKNKEMQVVLKQLRHMREIMSGHADSDFFNVVGLLPR